MQMFVLVLNREEFLEPILEKMLEAKIGGATILESTGMMRVLDSDQNVDVPMLGILRHYFSPERRRSKTMFALLDSHEIPKMLAIVNEVTGGLDKPDTGIAFAVPTTFVEGIEKTL